MSQQLTPKTADVQGELFTKAMLPRQLPIFKATPEDERMPSWARASGENQRPH